MAGDRWGLRSGRRADITLLLPCSGRWYTSGERFSEIFRDLRSFQSKAKAQKQTKETTSAAKTGTDKVVGKDAKGRTIYEGPKGGKYYINSQGNKEYITKEKGK